MLFLQTLKWVLHAFVRAHVTSITDLPISANINRLQALSLVYIAFIYLVTRFKVYSQQNMRFGMFTFDKCTVINDLFKSLAKLQRLVTKHLVKSSRYKSMFCVWLVLEFNIYITGTHILRYKVQVTTSILQGSFKYFIFVIRAIHFCCQQIFFCFRICLNTFFFQTVVLWNFISESMVVLQIQVSLMML